MDPLEDFIQHNKAAFSDPLESKERIWRAIEQDMELKEKPLVRQLYWRRWVVAASLVLGIALGAVWLNSAFRQIELASSSKSLEVLEIDAYYQKMINAKSVQVRQSSSLTDSQKSEIRNYLQRLQSESQELELELEKNVNNVQIIQAIIKNYRERLEIMENLLDRSVEQNSNKYERNISI